MNIAVEESQNLINEKTMAMFHHSDNQLSFWEFLFMNQGAYVAGRTADATEPEIEAVAADLYQSDCKAGRYGIPYHPWASPGFEQRWMDYRRMAASALAAGRKAVKENRP